MSLAIAIPGWRDLELDHLVMDLNGTLALDGRPVAGVEAALCALAPHLELYLVTANTFGTAQELFGPHVKVTVLQPGDEAGQKRRFVESLGAARTAALGNGANDVAMLQAAALGVVVLGPEGAATQALLAAQMVAPGPLAALELFLRPARVKAGLRR